ncbi:hypothetical protein CPC08DRAFT_753139 [Agrocybe pediades]|nr:hypothetical protein CPC08DRAFT_753139 [Agrocybe pediades]
MGQRHQAFVIARQGQRYRCIAALHHQWCYGRGPLRAAAQFLSLVQQPQNAWIIHKELDEHTASSLDHDDDIAIPCPFTNYLLSLAFSVNLEPDQESVSSRVSAYPVDYGSTTGDNNDGITVLDISDPFSPSYCFVSIYGLEAVADVPELVPLSAETYVRAYYPEEEEPSSEENEEASESALVENLVQAAIRSLDPYPVISLQTLHTTWPDEYDDPMEKETLSSTIPASAAQNNRDDVALPVVPSLVDVIFRRAVERAIATDTIDELEPFLNVEEKVSVMKDILRAQNPIEDGASFLLLQRLLQADLHSKTIDLSSLHLSKDQMQRLFHKQSQSWLDSVEHVDVSGLTLFDVDILRELVGCLPNLRRINLWNTAVTNQQLKDLLDREPHLFHRIERLIHPIFFNRSESSMLAPALSLIVMEKRPSYHSPIMTSLPYFTPSQIVQGLLDIFDPILMARKQGQADPFQDWDLMANILWTGAFASEARPQGASWSERVIPYMPSYARENFHAHQWFFVLDIKNKYAFGRFIPEVEQLLSSELKELKETDETTFRAEVNKVVDRMKSEHDGLFELFDVRAFFDALKEEGRLPPHPQALNRLLEVFAELSSLPGRRELPGLDVMSQNEFEDAVSPVLWPKEKRRLFRY